MTSLISPKLDIIVEDVQNVSLFAIASWSLFSYVYYNFTNSAAPFEALRPIVGVHAVLDLFVNKARDVKLHHMFILGIFFTIITIPFYPNINSRFCTLS